MGSLCVTTSMAPSLQSLLLCLLLSSAHGCNDVRDPIPGLSTTGTWNASRVEWKASGRQGSLVAVVRDTAHPLGQTAFYSGDSYVIQYSGEGRDRPEVIYYWQGSTSSVFEKGASAILTVRLDDSTGGGAKQA